MVRVLGLIGLVSGTAFGFLLVFAEHRKTVRDIPLERSAAWGIIASAITPLAVSKSDQILPMCIAGTIVALALVGIARKCGVVSSRPQRAVG